jgi:hypothetical protein
VAFGVDGQRREFPPFFDGSSLLVIPVGPPSKFQFHELDILEAATNSPPLYPPTLPQLYTPSASDPGSAALAARHAAKKINARKKREGDGIEMFICFVIGVVRVVLRGG